jgi:hypothetical protein
MGGHTGPANNPLTGSSTSWCCWCCFVTASRSDWRNSRVVPRRGSIFASISTIRDERRVTVPDVATPQPPAPLARRQAFRSAVAGARLRPRDRRVCDGQRHPLRSTASTAGLAKMGQFEPLSLACATRRRTGDVRSSGTRLTSRGHSRQSRCHRGGGGRLARAANLAVEVGVAESQSLTPLLQRIVEHEAEDSACWTCRTIDAEPSPVSSRRSRRWTAASRAQAAQASWLETA